MNDETIKLPDASRSAETLEGALNGLKGRKVEVLPTVGAGFPFEVVEVRKDYAIVVKNFADGRSEALHPYGSTIVYLPVKQLSAEEEKALEDALGDLREIIDKVPQEKNPNQGIIFPIRDPRRPQ